MILEVEIDVEVLERFITLRDMSRRDWMKEKEHMERLYETLKTRIVDSVENAYKNRG